MSLPQFTTDWFSVHIPIWKQALGPLAFQQHLCGLEIGVFEGRSICWLLENIFTHPTSRLDAVDTFEGSDEHAQMQVDLTHLYDRFLANTREYQPRLRTHRMKSTEFLRNKPLQEFETYDFIYVDGDHHASACLEDMVLSWPFLKRGGTMIIDDYGGGHGHPFHEVPKHGIDAFLHAYQTRYELVHMEYQVILKKKYWHKANARVSRNGVPRV